jgi:hypothetical protein
MTVETTSTFFDTSTQTGLFTLVLVSMQTEVISATVVLVSVLQ